jgi:hypothetical protein
VEHAAVLLEEVQALGTIALKDRGKERLQQLWERWECMWRVRQALAKVEEVRNGLQEMRETESGEEEGGKGESGEEEGRKGESGEEERLEEGEKRGVKGGVTELNEEREKKQENKAAGGVAEEPALHAADETEPDEADALSQTRRALLMSRPSSSVVRGLLEEMMQLRMVVSADDGDGEEEQLAVGTRQIKATSDLVVHAATAAEGPHTSGAIRRVMSQPEALVLRLMLRTCAAYEERVCAMLSTVVSPEELEVLEGEASTLELQPDVKALRRRLDRTREWSSRTEILLARDKTKGVAADKTKGLAADTTKGLAADNTKGLAADKTKSAAKKAMATCRVEDLVLQLRLAEKLQVSKSSMGVRQLQTRLEDAKRWVARATAQLSGGHTMGSRSLLELIENRVERATRGLAGERDQSY